MSAGVARIAAICCHINNLEHLLLGEIDAAKENQRLCCGTVEVHGVIDDACDARPALYGNVELRIHLGHGG
jgi:hypothetical protein